MSEAKTSTILGADLSTAAYDAQLMAPGVLFPGFGVDPHETDLIDEYEQFRRLFSSATAYFPRAFIDSTDTGLQFSTKAGQWQDESGTWRSVAERVNITGLTNAVENFVSYPSTATASTDLTISTSAWPTGSHVRVAIITPANSSLTPSAIDDYLSTNILRPVGPVASAAIATAFTFSYINIEASLTNQPMSLGGAATGVVCRKGGFIVGMTAALDIARTGGTLTVKPGKATVAGGAFSAISDASLDLTIDGTSPWQQSGSVVYGDADFAVSAGNRICPLITTDGSWTPVSPSAQSDILVVMEVVFASA